MQNKQDLSIEHFMEVQKPRPEVQITPFYTIGKDEVQEDIKNATKLDNLQSAEEKNSTYL